MNNIKTSCRQKVLQFRDYCSLKRAVTPALQNFVEFKHKNATPVITEDGIRVTTERGYYSYIDFGGKYFCRINLENQKKTFFEIN